MVPAGNKAKSLSLVNHTTKTIHHHHVMKAEHEVILKFILNYSILMTIA